MWLGFSLPLVSGLSVDELICIDLAVGVPEVRTMDGCQRTKNPGR